MDDDSCGFEVLGCDDEIGLDYGQLLQAAGGVAQYGVSAAEQEKKESAGKADDAKKLAAVIAADYAASEASAKADASAQLKSPSASIDAIAAQTALATQDAAGAAGFSSDSAKKRADSADQALAAAIKEAQSKPKDVFLAAKVKAWQATANKAHGSAIVSLDKGGSGGKGGPGGESFFTKKVLGPIPGWGVLTLGAGVLGAVAIVLKKFVFKAAA
jgi:hypothetical protein